MTICRERGNIFKQSASRSFTSEISGLRKQYGMRGWRNWQTRTFEVRVVYPWGFESPPSHQKPVHIVCWFFFLCEGGGARTRRRHLCRKQSHSAALLSLRVPTRRNVYQGCTHFVPVSFCTREGISNKAAAFMPQAISPVQQRRPQPAAETGRSCWGRVLIFQSPAKGLRKNQLTQPVAVA